MKKKCDKSQDNINIFCLVIVQVCILHKAYLWKAHFVIKYSSIIEHHNSEASSPTLLFTSFHWEYPQVRVSTLLQGYAQIRTFLILAEVLLTLRQPLTLPLPGAVDLALCPLSLQGGTGTPTSTTTVDQADCSVRQGSAAISTNHPTHLETQTSSCLPCFVRVIFVAVSSPFMSRAFTTDCGKQCSHD